MVLKLSHPNISKEAIDAVAQVLRSGQLVHGPECEAFERELAMYLGSPDVVLVSSGTAALHLALMVHDIGPGDAVIVPDFTFPATANVVAMVGAKPVIVDVDPGTYAIDVGQLEARVIAWNGPQRLRAIMPVHEFGAPADMKAICRVARDHGLIVIEDAACALGASDSGSKIGTQGDAGCFSFHPRKTLTTGEGGAIAVRDPERARRLRRLRNHGMERTEEGVRFLEPATNYRLTNFQAALGRHQLPHLDGWIARRRDLAGRYRRELGPLVEQALIRLPDEVAGHSWQTFMIVLDDRFDRADVISALKHGGVEANLGAQSLSEIGLYGGECPPMPVGERLWRQGLALPMFEQMSESDVLLVCRLLAAHLMS
jgi:perosamine synthetase